MALADLDELLGGLHRDCFAISESDGCPCLDRCGWEFDCHPFKVGDRQFDRYRQKCAATVAVAVRAILIACEVAPRNVQEKAQVLQASKPELLTRNSDALMVWHHTKRRERLSDSIPERIRQISQIDNIIQTRKGQFLLEILSA